MNSQPNSKVIGAFIIGFALVAGAYVANNFGKPSGSYTRASQSLENTQQAAPRSAIAVTDNDGNGIEDWRDEFITTKPIILNTTPNEEEYVAPDTLTGQLGINFVQDIIRSSAYGEFGRSNEEVITDTIKILEVETSFVIYDTPDIIVLEDWSPQDIKNYANVAAQTILNNSQIESDHELLILQDVMNRNDASRISELETLSEVYRLMKEGMLQIPVPAPLVKEHLDLINTFHAINNDIKGMTLAFDDPAYSLMRLKRYEDDVLGMSQALENMYLSLEPYASLFTTSDPAVFFVTFSPGNNVRI